MGFGDAPEATAVRRGKIQPELMVDSKFKSYLGIWLQFLYLPLHRFRPKNPEKSRPEARRATRGL